MDCAQTIFSFADLPALEQRSGLIVQLPDLVEGALQLGAAARRHRGLGLELLDARERLALGLGELLLLLGGAGLVRQVHGGLDHLGQRLEYGFDLRLVLAVGRRHGVRAGR